LVSASVDTSQTRLEMKRMTKRLKRLKMGVQVSTRLFVKELKQSTPKATGELRKGWTYRTKMTKDGFVIVINHKNEDLLRWLEYGTTVSESDLIFPTSKKALSFKPTDGSEPTEPGGRIARAWAHKHEIKPRGFIRKSLKSYERELSNVFRASGIDIKVKFGKPLL